jgi:HPt (histidine-containing phosphotransfer) domain-containing protein
MFEWLTKTAEPPPAVLDEAYLRRLESHVGSDAMAELMSDGLIELKDKLDNLEARAGSATVKQIAPLCHDIAGAAGNLGLTAMTQAAVQANRSAIGDNPPPVAEIAALVLACRDVAFEEAEAFRSGFTPPGVDDEAQMDPDP